jgi:hypothetical protein
LLQIITKESGDTSKLQVPSIFSPTDTPEVIADKATDAANAAAVAALAAAASVKESQVTVDALAEAATNGIPATPSLGSSSIFNPFAITPGSSAGFGTQAPPVTLNLTVEGSILTENDFVKVVADALVIANTNGQNTSRPGSLTLLP